MTYKAVPEIVVSQNPASNDEAKRDAPEYSSQKVIRLSRSLAPDQVSELLAIMLADMHATRCPVHPSHWVSDGVYGPLVDLGLIIAKRVPAWTDSSWLAASLTELGERVLLRVAEHAMVETGAMRAILDVVDSIE